MMDMANVPSSAYPPTPPNPTLESLLTSAELDDFPPVPELPPIDPSLLTRTPDVGKMAAYDKTAVELKYLKAEIAAIHSQRLVEQDAYRAIVQAMEALNTHLPRNVRTPEMGQAIRNIVNATHLYRSLAQSLNDRMDQMQGISLSAQPQFAGPQRHTTTLSIVSKPDSSTFVPRQPPLPSSPSRTKSRTQQQKTALLLKQYLAQLQVSEPPRNSSLDAALSHLQSNVSSFAPFVVAYLNGRHGHFASGVRSQVNSIVGVFFEDPADGKQVVNKIMKVLKDGIKYTEDDVQPLSKDIVAPMGAVLWHLVKLLEEEARVVAQEGTFVDAFG